MKFNVLINMFKETFRSIVRHPIVSLASLTTVVLMLLILGVFVIFSSNANYIIKRVGSEPPVQIWMDDAASAEDRENVTAALENSSYVKSFVALSPQDNYKLYEERLGEDSDLVASLDPEIMPYSYTIKLNSPDDITAFNETMNTYPGIEEIQFSQVVLDFFSDTGRNINYTMLIGLIALLAIAILIIYNMVRISILARADEINIMKYVGATNAYVRVPHLLEGAIIGSLGGIIASIITLLVYAKVYEWFMRDTLVASALALVPIADLRTVVLATLVGVGLVVGVLGSAISVRKHVNV